MDGEARQVDDSSVASFPPVQIAGFVGIGLLVLYGIGFLVSNAYLGGLWLVDPSFLQARYVSAGLLWFTFAAVTVIPAYYLVRLRRELQRPSARSEAHGDQARPSGWLARSRSLVGRSGRWLGFWLVFLWLVFILIGPSYVFGLLFVLGAPPAMLAWPALGFWAIAIVLVAAHLAFDLGLREYFLRPENPHRWAGALIGLLMHAGVFGYVVYPMVPPSMGGGRPIPVTLLIDRDSHLPQVMGLPRGGPVEGAFLVSSTSDFLLTMVPRSGPQNGTPAFCGVAIPKASVVGVLVAPSYSPWRRGGTNLEWPARPGDRIPTISRCSP